MSQTCGRWDTYVDALKLDDSSLLALLAVRRDVVRNRSKGQGDPRIENSRGYRRVSVQGALWVPADIRESNGNILKLKAYPIDLSSSGVCLLVDRLLGPGMTCVLTLRLLDGELLRATGRIARCEHVQGRVHEAGVQFDQALDLALFLPDMPSTSVSPACPAVVASAKEESADVTTSSRASLGAELGHRLPEMAGQIKSIAERIASLKEDSAHLMQIARALDVSTAPG